MYILGWRDFDVRDQPESLSGSSPLVTTNKLTWVCKVKLVNGECSAYAPKTSVCDSKALNIFSSVPILTNVTVNHVTKE